MPSFPPGFRFGAATASYQIEGAGARRRPRPVDLGHLLPHAGQDRQRRHRRRRLRPLPPLARGRRPHGRARPRDLPLLDRLAARHPVGAGPVNPAGLRFYRDLIDGLLERGIEPAATLYHWDLPQALQDAGGWANRDTAERFAEYAQHMARELGDRVRTWITHNEPWVATFVGHAQGRSRPACATGPRRWPSATTCCSPTGSRVPARSRAASGSRSTSRPSHPAGARRGGRRRGSTTATSTAGSSTRCCAAPTRPDLLEPSSAASARSTAIRDGDLELIARADRLPRRQLLLPLARARGRERRSRWASPSSRRRRR